METQRSLLSQIDIFIRSLLFFLFSSVAIFIYSFFCILAMPLPLDFRYRMISGFTGVLVSALKIICRIDYHIEGLENIPSDRNGIVMSKHQSTWETFFLPTLFHQSAIILKRELLWVPFFGWGLRITDPIAIDRSQRSSAMEQILAKGKACLNSGRWILIFPEGTRIKPGLIGKYKTGGARLATQSGYPIIPVAHNAGYFWPKRSFLKLPGTIKVVIGPLMESQGESPEVLMEKVKAWIEGEMQKIGSV